MSILNGSSSDFAEFIKNNFIIFHFIGNKVIIDRMSIHGDHENSWFYSTGVNQNMSKERNQRRSQEN